MEILPTIGMFFGGLGLFLLSLGVFWIGSLYAKDLEKRGK